MPFVLSYAALRSDVIILNLTIKYLHTRLTFVLILSYLAEGSCPASLSKVLENTNNKFEVSDKKIVRLDQDAKDSSGNATATKKRAQDLLDKLKKFTSELEGSFIFLYFPT